jgi:hypothetical protein
VLELELISSEISLPLSTRLVEWHTIVKKVTMMVMAIDVSSSKRKRSVAENSLQNCVRP